MGLDPQGMGCVATTVVEGAGPVITRLADVHEVSNATFHVKVIAWPPMLVTELWSTARLTVRPAAPALEANTQRNTRQRQRVDRCLWRVNLISPSSRIVPTAGSIPDFRCRSSEPDSG